MFKCLFIEFVYILPNENSNFDVISMLKLNVIDFKNIQF